jgi:diketogulonate reductase-like aldo/keto reductase
VDRIDLYYWHRPDRTIRYAEAIESLATLQADGLIAEIGISNANVEEILVAIDVLGDGALAAVQNEFSPKFNHTSYPELLFCGKRGIAFLPWSPLGGTSGGATAVGERFGVIADVAAAGCLAPGVDLRLGQGDAPEAQRRRAGTHQRGPAAAVRSLSPR